LKVLSKSLQSYEKSRAEQNKYIYFLCRDRVTYQKLRKIVRKTKRITSFLPVLLKNEENKGKKDVRLFIL